VLGTFAALGAWHGAFAPRALGRPGSDATKAGAITGAGVGLLLGYGVAQAHLEPELEGALVLGTAVGSFTGYGLGELLAWNDGRLYKSLELGSAAALVIGGVAAPFLRLDPASAALIGTSMAWGAWEGGWLGNMLTEEGNTSAHRVRGGALLGTGVGLAVGAGLSQVLERSPADLVEASVMLAAGNAMGFGAGEVLHLSHASSRGLLQVGGLGALALGLAVAPETSYRDRDPVFVGMTTVVAASHGLMLRGLFAPSGSDLDQRGVIGGAAFGAGAGVIGGMLLSQRLHLDGADIGEVAMATVAGDGLGFGLATWLGLEGRAFYGMIEAGALATTALGLIGAPATQYSASDALFVGYAATFGGWLGGWAPTVWDGDLHTRGPGVALGVAAGGLVGAVASQQLHLDATDATEAALGTTLTTAVGAGLGLALSRNDRVWAGSMEVTGLVSAAAWTAIAPHTELSRGDMALGSLAAVYGVYQGAGVSILANASNRKVGGSMLAAGAAGALVGSYFGHYLHLDTTELLMLTAGSAWGMWIGLWSAPLIESLVGTDRGVVAAGVGTTAVATDLAVAATALAISRIVEMPPQRFAWISLAGGFGVVGGVAAAALTGGGGQRFQAGCVLGSIAGLATGTVVTGFFDFTPRPRPAGALTGNVATGKGALAMLPDIELVMPSVQAMPRDPNGPPKSDAMLFTLTGTWR
jgi:hypothetical protein